MAYYVRLMPCIRPCLYLAGLLSFLGGIIFIIERDNSMTLVGFTEFSGFDRVISFRENNEFTKSTRHLSVDLV